jgi:hypothetical protein
MKRIATFGLVLAMVVVAFVACGPKAGAPAAGAATAEDMVRMFPKEAVGLLVVDIHRVMQTEAVQKMITGKDESPKYQDFVKETGIDPQKDVYYLAGGMMGDIEHPEGTIIVNAKFNKDALLAKIKEKGGELKESVYEGVTIYEIHPPVKEASLIEGETSGDEGEAEETAETQETEKPATEMAPSAEKPGYGAFLSDSNIALGTEAGIKSVIDVLKGKREDVLKNPEMAKLIKESNQKAMLWAVLSIPPDSVKKMTESNPMLASLSGVHSLLLSFDYRDKAIQAEVKLMSSDATKNKQIADFLNGMKALGGMAGNSKPAVGELMNKIEITSGPDFVSVKADIPEDLLNRLGEEAKKVVPQMEKGKAPEAESKTE